MGNYVSTVIEVDLEYIPVEPRNYNKTGIIRSHFDFFHINLNFCHYLISQPRIPILIRSLHQTACCRRRHLLAGTRPTRRFLSTFFSCVASSSTADDHNYPVEDVICFARDLDGEFVRPNPYKVVELNVKIMLLSQMTTIFELPAPVTWPEATHLIKRVRELDDGEEEMNSKRRRQIVDSCRICLEDIDDHDTNNNNCGMAAALPCGHVYHQNCIVFWLRNNHLCPLCRYPMPAAAMP